MKKLVILSGAGVSAESGISTFRDSGGLWEGHDVMEVASPEGFSNNPELVLDFYNKRRRQLFDVQPNKAHFITAQLEQDFNVTVVTQNVDDLHERAGSTNVIHLHGELLKARSINNYDDVVAISGDILLGDLHTDGHQLRPHIVWFGEAVPEIERAAQHVETADYIIVIGTSLQVYPAAGLIDFAKPSAIIYYIDTYPATLPNLRNKLEVLPLKASEGMEMVMGILVS